MSFIVIEGIDRSGKSTQARMLFDKLTKCGLLAEMFSFPNYGSSTGKFISEHLYNKVFLTENSQQNFLAITNRISSHDALIFQCAQTCDKYAMASKIIAILRKGNTVVCDRWWQSAFVYGLDDGLDSQWLKDIHSCLPQADLNLLLDLTTDEAADRPNPLGIPLNRHDCDRPKQRRLRDAYLQLWEDQGKIQRQDTWKVLPANDEPEEIHERIVTCVKNHLEHLCGRD